MKNKTRRDIYLWGALWNLSLAFSGLALPGFTMWLISGSADIITGVLPRTFFAFSWLAVALFGIGYFIVSRDPDKNKAVIWLGCAGKVIFFLTFGHLFLSKVITLFGFLCGFGDFIWTFFFLAALRGEKTKAIA